MTPDIQEYLSLNLIFTELLKMKLSVIVFLVFVSYVTTARIKLSGAVCGRDPDRECVGVGRWVRFSPNIDGWCKNRCQPDNCELDSTQCKCTCYAEEE